MVSHIIDLVNNYYVFKKPPLFGAVVWARAGLWVLKLVVGTGIG